MQVHIVTIFPDFINRYLEFGPLARAIALGSLQVHVINLRDYAVDDRGSVDGAPYGGGDGMVMRPEPLGQAIESIKVSKKVLLLDPSGTIWSQSYAHRLVNDTQALVLLCGRFGGIDQRVIDLYVNEIISVGDFVLTGGELPALMVIDTMVRMLPHALGNPESFHSDSFGSGMDGQLEHPLYTRPVDYCGLKVPDVLLSGDHTKIAAWRREHSRLRTQKLRPDLLSCKNPSK